MSRIPRGTQPLSLVYLLVTMALTFTFANAQLAVTEPSTDHWWVADSVNTLRWTGSTPSEFSVFLVNADTNVLTSKLALISVQPYYEYSKNVNPGNIKPSTGYTIQLTNTLNSSDIYATSQSFEIKAKGSTYPPQGTAAPSGSSVSSGTGSGSAVSATVTTSRSNANGKWEHITFVYGGALIGGICASAVLCSSFRDFQRIEDGTAEGWVQLGDSNNTRSSRTFQERRFTVSSRDSANPAANQ